MNTWFNWIWNTFPHLPMEVNGDEKNGVPVKMSRSRLKRIFNDGAILIDGQRFNHTSPKEPDELPSEIVWFPKSDKFRNTWG